MGGGGENIWIYLCVFSRGFQKERETVGNSLLKKKKTFFELPPPRKQHVKSLVLPWWELCQLDCWSGLANCSGICTWCIDLPRGEHLDKLATDIIAQNWPFVVCAAAKKAGSKIEFVADIYGNRGDTFWLNSTFVFRSGRACSLD